MTELDKTLPICYLKIRKAFIYPNLESESSS